MVVGLLLQPPGSVVYDAVDIDFLRLWSPKRVFLIRNSEFCIDVFASFIGFIFHRQTSFIASPPQSVKSFCIFVVLVRCRNSPLVDRRLLSRFFSMHLFSPLELLQVFSSPGFSPPPQRPPHAPQQIEHMRNPIENSH